MLVQVNEGTPTQIQTQMCWMQLKHLTGLCKILNPHEASFEELEDLKCNQKGFLVVSVKRQSRN